MAENQSRNQNFKNVSKSNTEMRTRRHEVTLELRKTKKEDQMFKRRNIDVLATSPLKENNTVSPPAPLMPLSDIIVGMQSSDPAIVLQATQSARKMLSKECNPPIDVLINYGVVPMCVKFLDSDRYVAQQFGHFAPRPCHMPLNWPMPLHCSECQQ